MTEADLIAIGGFVVLFSLMLLRVPIGVAMGLVGVGGFAHGGGHWSGSQPACPVADPHHHRFQPDAHPVLRADGRACDQFRNVTGTVQNRTRLVRQFPGRSGVVDHRCLCRLCRHLWIVRGDRCNHDQDRAAGDEACRLPRRYLDRRDRCRRNVGYSHPAIRCSGHLCLHHRTGRRKALCCGYPSRLPRRGHVHAHGALRLCPRTARRHAFRSAGSHPFARRRLGRSAAVHLHNRQHLFRAGDRDRGRCSRFVPDRAHRYPARAT